MIVIWATPSNNLHIQLLLPFSWNIMQSYCKNQHGSSLKSALRTFCLVTVLVEDAGSCDPARAKAPLSKNPTAAGTNENFPSPEDCSIAGISRLHMEAATITPAVKPVSALLNLFIQILLHEKYAGGSCRSSKKRNQNSIKYIYIHQFIPPVFICMQIKEIGSCYLFDLVSLF